MLSKAEAEHPARYDITASETGPRAGEGSEPGIRGPDTPRVEELPETQDKVAPPETELSEGTRENENTTTTTTVTTNIKYIQLQYFLSDFP